MLSAVPNGLVPLEIAFVLLSQRLNGILGKELMYEMSQEDSCNRCVGGAGKRLFTMLCQLIGARIANVQTLEVQELDMLLRVLVSGHRLGKVW